MKFSVGSIALTGFTLANAFSFGHAKDQLPNASPVTAPNSITVQSEPASTLILGPAPEATAPAAKKLLQDAPFWTLTNVTRRTTTENRVWVGFHIKSEGYDTAFCYLLAHTNTDPKTASFANQKCSGSNYTVSWGYDNENDAGILTLISTAARRNAWFGWNYVNDSEKLHDAGPNATGEMK